MMRFLPLMVAAVGGLLLFAAFALPREGREHSTDQRVAGRLQGETTCDLGDIWLTDSSAPFEHVFTLRNVGRETVVIDRIQPSCGCLGVTSQSAEVGAEDSLDITVRLDPLGTGARTVFADLHDGAESLARLVVKYRARRMHELLTASESVVVSSEAPAQVMIYWTDFTSEVPPPTAEVRIEGSFDATVGAWELMDQLAPDAGLPARWTASVKVESRSDYGGDGVLIISVPKSKEVRVRLAGKR